MIAALDEITEGLKPVFEYCTDITKRLEIADATPNTDTKILLNALEKLKIQVTSGLHTQTQTLTDSIQESRDQITSGLKEQNLNLEKFIKQIDDLTKSRLSSQTLTITKATEKTVENNTESIVKKFDAMPKGSMDMEKVKNSFAEIVKTNAPEFAKQRE